MRGKNVIMKKATALVLVAGLFVAGASCQAVSAKKKVALNYKKLVLKVGQKKKLKVKNTKKKVRWSSKNKKIATVSQKGVVKAKKKGVVKIVAKIGKKKYTCAVTVKNEKAAMARVTEQPSSKPVVTKTPVIQPPQQTEPAVIPTAAPSFTPIPTPPQPTMEPTPTPTPDPGWDAGKKSGTEEDFNKYFALELKNYTKKQDGTVLGTVETATYHSDVVGADREAYVYLPPEYDTNKKYPVLYMIHGIGCDKGQWYSMSLNNILSNMICSGEVAPFIAVLPSVIPKDGVSSETLGSENIGAFTKFEEEFLKDLEPYILQNYSVSPEREDTGVCGLSMGGMEALHLGFAIKDHFNYIGSFSAAPTLDQSLLTLSGWKTTPDLVLVCSGTADNTVGSNPYNYHMTLENNQVDHIWYQYPNGGHDTRVWQNGLVNFLKRSF